MNSLDIIEYLKIKFQQKRKDHPSFRLLDIDDNLFPNGIITFETEALDYDNKLKTVKNIVAESWKKSEKNHLMIQGEGGIGKTVTLLSLPDKFIPYPIPAIYIPLHEVKGDYGTIEKYIKKRVLDNNEDLYGAMMDLFLNKPWNNGPQLLLLLDGFNEISHELRGCISEDIEQWSEFSGIQVITSSRFDIHQYVALHSSFFKIELQPLSEKTVLRYLESNNIDSPKHDAVTKLITIPLLLTLYIKTETIRKKRPSPFAKFLETKNAGTLIWNYLQCELWRFRNNNRESVACILAMEFIAPYVAWTMQQNSEFFVDESSFLDRIDEVYRLMDKHIENNGAFPIHIKTTIQQSTRIPDSISIISLLKESLCLFIGNDGSYRLMHQLFRDALAAMHLINMSYLSGNSLPQEWGAPIDHYVMQFVADLINENEANRLWEQNRNTYPTIESATRNQLELQKNYRNYDFSKLNFSGIDLSHISLFPYRVGNTKLKLTDNVDYMDGTILSEKTFLSEGHSQSVVAVAVTIDGRHIISGSSDNTIRIWDLESGECLKTLEGHKNSVRAITMTPDGMRIVSGSDDETICVWNLESGECINTLEGPENYVRAVAMTPDGKSLISGSRDGIRIWDMKSGVCLKKINDSRKSAEAIAVTPDGKHIISGSDNHTINIWNVAVGKRIRTLKGHWESVNAIAITPDGRHIVSGSSDNTIRIWNMKSGECIKVLNGHGNGVNAVAVTPDGRRVVSGSGDKTICIWDLESGECLKTLEGHKNSVRAIAMTPDGRRIVSGSDDKTICVWDLESRERLNTMKGSEQLVNVVAVLPNSRYIICGLSDSTLRIWNLKNGVCVKTLEGHNRSVIALAFTPNERHIISASYDNTIRVWDWKAGVCIKTLEGHKKWIRVVAITPDGRRIVSGSDDNTIRIWDLESGKCLKTLEGHQNWVRTIVITPNGKHVISGSDDNTIRIWDLESGKCLKTLKGHQNWVSAVAVTPDGRHIISWSEIIRIWDLMSGKCIKKLNDHKIWVNSVAMIPNYKEIVCEASNKAIRILNLSNEKCLYTLEGHKRAVNYIAATPDGRYIVSGSNDQTIRVWDLFENGRCVITIRIHPLSFVGLDFSKAIISTPELKEQLRQNGAKV